MRAGRDGRFEAVYRECRRDVKLYARARVGRDHEDDVVNATFLSVWQRLDEIPWPSRRAWVLGVCRNHCRNRWRADRRFAALVDEVIAARPALELGLSTDGWDIDAVAALAAVLPNLSLDDRELFVLSAWLGMMPSEIAETLGVPAGRVRVRLHRLRVVLAHHLGVDAVRDGTA